MQCGSPLILLPNPTFLWFTPRFYVVQGKESTLGISCYKDFCLVLPWQVFKPRMCAARESRKPYLAFCVL